MTSETRSPTEIEREIETQRSALTSNIEDLQQKFSIDALVRQVSDQFREHGGDMGRSITDQVKSNPIPLALTGIGLAWMMFGNSQRPVSSGNYNRVEDDYRQSRLATERSYTRHDRASSTFESDPSWSRESTDIDGPSTMDRLSSGASSASQKVSEGVSSAGDKVSSGLTSVESGVTSAASSAKSAVTRGAESIRDSVSSAGSRIAEGTESLTEEGRERVIAARQKAVEMRRSAARSVSQGADAAADLYERQPLVVGALALAVGAALGGALPRTRTEDGLMGEQSDHLFAEAERIYEEEKSKVTKVAQSVSDEVKDVATETKADLDRGAPGEKTATEAIADKAKTAADRMKGAAETTAKQENLGKPKTS